MQENIDIDSRINWVDFYSRYVKNPKPCGKDKMHACCPFHEERHPSFWFNTKNGCFKCEGCGESGNATTFLAKVKGIDQKEAYKEFLELAGIDPNRQAAKPQKKALPVFNIAIYGAEKCFTTEWLKDECKMSDGTDQSGKYVKIPYADKAGSIVATRKRYHKDNPNGKFKWQKGSTLRLYGLWRKFSEDYVILVEGESDSQSLWVLGLPAYGVPGATNFQTKWVEDLSDIPKVYLHIEPDKGGQTFKQQMISKLYEGGYQGEVYTFNLGEYDVKDPSELYCRDGVDATDEIQAAISKAEYIDLQLEAENLPELVSGMPVLLKEPEGWKLSDDGIFKYETRTEQYKRVCRTPIIIVKRLRNIETDEEKIQIAFKIRGKWKYGIFPSTTIYQSRNIVSLADLGALITSENAKAVVSFLEALESENIDRIQEAKSVSQLGWATEKNFLPGHAGDIVLDVERSMIGRVNAYQKKGSYEEWLSVMSKHRERNRFRFILAAAFAPPILKIVNQRIFFIYNWGGSEGGKTAALHAALSAWGDPESLKVSFNATKVGLEQTAAFFKDLPFGLNERQLAGTKQESVEQLVYMLAEGGSKIRGTKNGGLQAIKQWRTVIIANGEEPLSNDSTQTGVSTRVLEVYGPPFDDAQEASDIYPFTSENHGAAGVEFVAKLLDTGEKEIIKINREITQYIKENAKGQSGSHIDGVSTIATADTLISVWLFGEERETAIERAVEMSTEILLMQQTAKSRDVNISALQYIVDWISSNSTQFGADARSPAYGFVSSGKWYIYPSILNEALDKMHFSARKTLKFLAEQDVITKSAEGKFSVVKYNESRSGRYVEFDLSRATDILSKDDEKEQPEDVSFEDFTEVDDDSDLPS